jgi:hypothetical protein
MKFKNLRLLFFVSTMFQISQALASVHYLTLNSDVTLDVAADEGNRNSKNLFYAANPGVLVDGPLSSAQDACTLSLISFDKSIVMIPAGTRLTLTNVKRGTIWLGLKGRTLSGSLVEEISDAKVLVEGHLECQNPESGRHIDDTFINNILGNFAHLTTDVHAGRKLYESYLDWAQSTKMKSTAHDFLAKYFKGTSKAFLGRPSMLWGSAAEMKVSVDQEYNSENGEYDDVIMYTFIANVSVPFRYEWKNGASTRYNYALHRYYLPMVIDQKDGTLRTHFLHPRLGDSISDLSEAKPKMPTKCTGVNSHHDIKGHMEAFFTGCDANPAYRENQGR